MDGLRWLTDWFDDKQASKIYVICANPFLDCLVALSGYTD